MQRFNNAGRSSAVKRFCFHLPRELALWTVLFVLVVLTWSGAVEIVYFILGQ